MSDLHLPFTKTTLPNGLDVIVHEDHRLPIAAVSVWYHVGSKNERVGQTGLAHLFEHVMFEGSAHAPKGFFEPIQEAGGTLNGSTSADRTNYWEVVPKGALERALWMEADRMGWLLPALSDERFKLQRDVVLNERRQNYENRPYGMASFALGRALFPPDHPYSWPPIGWPEDLLAATVDDARAFFLAFYHPANASLAIAGDVTVADAVAMAERFFGPIPRGPIVPSVTPPVAAPRSRRVFIEDRVELPRLHLAWLSPALFAAGDAALDVAADILANGKTARLYRRLLYDERIAADLSAAQQSRELQGQFQIAATAAPGMSLADIAAIVASAIARLASEGPTADELERSRVQAEMSFFARLQTLGGTGGKSDQLNAYNVYRGTPEYFAQDFARYRVLTTDDVRAAVREWLSPDGMTALSIVPRGRRDLALPDSDPIEVQ